MNKIYALKYCHATGGLIAVSELASRVMKKAARGSLLALFNLSLYGAFLSASQAAQLNIDNVWARDYLDLAQNKGGLKLVRPMFQFNSRMARRLIFQMFQFLISRRPQIKALLHL